MEFLRTRFDIESNFVALYRIVCVKTPLGNTKFLDETSRQKYMQEAMLIETSL